MNDPVSERLVEQTNERADEVQNCIDAVADPPSVLLNSWAITAAFCA